MARGRKDPPKPSRRGPAPRREALRLLGEGLTAAEVSRRVGVHERTVRKWRDAEGSSAVVEAAAADRAATFADAVAEARSLLKGGAPRAAQTLLDHLDHTDPQAALRAAATLLDRVGVPRTQRIETAEPEGEDLSALTDEEFAALRAIKAKLKAARPPGATG